LNLHIESDRDEIAPRLFAGFDQANAQLREGATSERIACTGRSCDSTRFDFGVAVQLDRAAAGCGTKMNARATPRSYACTRTCPVAGERIGQPRET
jgi:hypothetical protein